MKPALRLPIVLGLLGTLLLTGSLAWAKFTTTPTSLNFGIVARGSTHAMNVNVKGITKSKVKVTGETAPYSASPTSFTVKKNQDVTVTVTFAPTTTGTFSETIKFNKQVVTVTGQAEEEPTPTATSTGPTPTATVTPTATPTPSGKAGNDIPVWMGLGMKHGK